MAYATALSTSWPKMGASGSACHADGWGMGYLQSGASPASPKYGIVQGIMLCRVLRGAAIMYRVCVAEAQMRSGTRCSALAWHQCSARQIDQVDVHIPNAASCDASTPLTLHARCVRMCAPTSQSLGVQACRQMPLALDQTFGQVCSASHLCECGRDRHQDAGGLSRRRHRQPLEPGGAARRAASLCRQGHLHSRQCASGCASPWDDSCEQADCMVHEAVAVHLVEGGSTVRAC